MGRYVVREAEEYYDMDACDARGNPVKRIRYTGVEYETTVDPDGDYVEMGPNGWEIHKEKKKKGNINERIQCKRSKEPGGPVDSRLVRGER